MVTPSGAGDDIVGLKHISGMQKQRVVFDAIYVVTNDFQIATAKHGPEVWNGDDAKSGIAPKGTELVSHGFNMGKCVDLPFLFYFRFESGYVIPFLITRILLTRVCCVVPKRTGDPPSNRSPLEKGADRARAVENRGTQV